MSKYIDEIIADIKQNPQNWMDYKANGVQKGNIIVNLYGNSKLLSVINVRINNKEMPTKYIDRWRLEAVIKWWYESVSLKTISA